MQKCEKCHTKFKWIEIYKHEWKSFWNRSILKCRMCDTEHVISTEARIISSILMSFAALTSLSLVLFWLDTFDILSLFLFFLVNLVFCAVVFTIPPFLFKFHSKYHSNYKVLK
ncbi:TIGR04104 family putative zinc finger protein [Ornithinibacillus contaminans]|uniref:TIGR04104 family putative zinc finger protein n=1 Tax=Ornithinibacillus contaminans TaxID=694055 RepID=UPI00064D8DB6